MTPKFITLVSLLLVLSANRTTGYGAFRPTLLDPSFTADYDALVPENSYIASVVPQTDGKILIAGGGFELIMTRLNRDGSIDPSFQLDPAYKFGFEHSQSSAFVDSISLPNGKILAVEVFGNQERVVRFNEDGSIDQTFHMTVLDLDNHFHRHSFASLPDGRVLITGSFSHVDGISSRGVVILFPDGQVDSRFDFRTFTGNVNSVALLPDGKLLVGQSFETNHTPTAPLLLRLNPDGSLDTSYDPPNGPLADLFGIDIVRVQPDGKLLLAGRPRTPPLNGLESSILIRLTADGSLDPDFTPCREVREMDITLLEAKEDRILVGGRGSRFGGFTFRFVSLKLDGSLMQNLTEGLERANSNAMVLAIAPDGNLVGTAWTPHPFPQSRGSDLSNRRSSQPSKTA
jgi:uncharacterized delta-60 repeat protein